MRDPAFISVVHCHAASFESTDWPQTIALYNHLFSVIPTPMVALNRAIAIGETDGPDAALAVLGTIARDLDSYHLMHAARGTMLRRLGHRAAAKATCERTADLAAMQADRQFLVQQIEELVKECSSGSIRQSN